jgi:hypothetical protein
MFVRITTQKQIIAGRKVLYRDVIQTGRSNIRSNNKYYTTIYKVRPVFQIFRNVTAPIYTM